MFRGLIIENTFLSISHMVDHVFSFLSPFKSLILRIGWDNYKYVPELRIPQLYITGDSDEIVPHEQTKKLYDYSNSSVFKDLLVVKKGDHNGSWYTGGKEYLDKIDGFIKKCII